jgi:uncharacterized membrane protein YhaH (DUF805 family)
MNDSPAVNALKSSVAALVVAIACVAMFLPPLQARTVESPLSAAAVGVALATALLLHWVFLAIAARRLERSVSGWLSLSVLLFPVGSVASLVLLGWFCQESAAPAATA